MFTVLTFNNIAPAGLTVFSKDHYTVGPDATSADAILLRSQKLHDYDFEPTVKVIARAGAGTNNVPIDKLTELGIPVLNTPGANANAVKELVLTGMLLASRNICSAWDYARNIEGDDSSINQQVEKNKKQFAGFELPGKKLGIIGLGHIGVKVANAACDLGLEVVGFDPSITVKNAWQLRSSVQQADNLEDVLKETDFITLHVPLNDHTRNLIDADKIKKMKPGAVILNFARDGIVNNGALLEALNKEKIRSYVCDFPSNALKLHPHVICLPHLGASTREAEENCAVMAAEQICDFLEHGHIRNSVNFPAVKMPRTDGHRLSIINANVPNMVAQVSSLLSDANINIIDMINKSRGEIAYTLIDTNTVADEKLLKALEAIKGVIRVRLI